MAARIRSENINTTVGALVADFAGRMPTHDHPNAAYDAEKLVHIHRRNRAYVWSPAMQKACLDSILKGYYIPPIITSSVIVEGRERREVMEGGNRITTFARILDGAVQELSEADRRIVEAYPITVVVMRNLNAEQLRTMFRRLNKSVKVSDGQLFAMSEDDSPLVREALALLEADDHPLRAAITDLFFDTRGKDNAGKNLLSNAVALISGALHGPEFITKSFDRQERWISSQEPVNRAYVVEMLGRLFEVIRQANARHPLTDKRLKKGQFTVGRWLGVILFDLLSYPDQTQQIIDKWATYIVKIRRGDSNALTLQDQRIWGKNLTKERHRMVSVLVDIFLRDNRIASKEELARVIGELGSDADEEGASVEAEEDDE
jgi:hypothetical protein